MATPRVDMKGYYKQQKKKNASKNSEPSTKSGKKKTTTPSQSPALVFNHGSFDLQDDYDPNEEVLRQFDMNATYGPCMGMSRLDRWNRAVKLGMNPPKEIETLLKSNKVHAECLWNGLV
ncbi:unnamed protein product [Amaranthus hypochondriacus]